MGASLLSNGVVRRLVALVALIVAAGSAAETNVDTGTVIENVTLVSPERSTALPHAYVVIRNGRIAQISTSPVSATRIRRIDGRGRFLI
jgi:hypothetical protein